MCIHSKCFLYAHPSPSQQTPPYNSTNTLVTLTSSVRDSQVLLGECVHGCRTCPPKINSMGIGPPWMSHSPSTTDVSGTVMFVLDDFTEFRQTSTPLFTVRLGKRQLKNSSKSVCPTSCRKRPYQIRPRPLLI